MLIPLISSEGRADHVNISPKYRSLLNARALQFIHATVSRNVGLQIQNTSYPFVAFQHLKELYSATRFQDFVDIYKRFTDLRFRIGYDAIRFVGDFENCIEYFEIAGTSFSEKYKAATFPLKIT